VVCSRCGRQNPDDSLFCAQCGAPLVRPESSTEQTSTIALSAIEDHGDEEAASELTGVVEALTPGSALLVVKRGPNAGSRFLLDKDVTTAGRHPESDIFLDDVTVSRRHGEFRRTSDGGFEVRDVGSLNGTYLNRERIESSELTGGDEVQIGKFRLVFLTGPRGESGGSA
jgi:pSer/pThr/pTyr-binding forkhead associated (FHA) protein/ribosomal protein L40E